ncbi:hypothetical protein UT300012_23460 [Paraclostridium bifermentans]
MKINIKKLVGNAPYYSSILIRSNGLCFETNFREIDLGEGEHLLLNMGKWDCIVVKSDGSVLRDVRQFSEAFILSQKLLNYAQDLYYKSKAEKKVKTFGYNDFNLDSIVPPTAYRVFKSLDGRELEATKIEMHNYVPVVASFISSGYLTSMVFYKVDDKLVIDTNVISTAPIRMIKGSRADFAKLIHDSRQEVLDMIPIKVLELINNKELENIEHSVSPGLQSSVLFNWIKGSTITIATLGLNEGDIVITRELDNDNEPCYASYEEIPRSQEIEIVLKANQVALVSTNDTEKLIVVGVQGETIIDTYSITNLGILESIRNKHKQKLK